MSVMNYVSSEIKIIAVKHSLVGTESLNQSAARFGVSRSTLQKWLFEFLKCLARKVYAIGPETTITTPRRSSAKR